MAACSRVGATKNTFLLEFMSKYNEIPNATQNDFPHLVMQLAIIRLCSCFETTLEIIEPCGFYLNDKRIKRVAMDYLNKSKIITYKSYKNFLIEKKNTRIILMTTKAKKIITILNSIPKTHCFLVEKVREFQKLYTIILIKD